MVELDPRKLNVPPEGIPVSTVETPSQENLDSVTDEPITQKATDSLEKARLVDRSDHYTGRSGLGVT